LSIDIRQHHPLFSSATALLLKTILFPSEWNSRYCLNIGIDEEEEKRQLLMTAIPDCVDPELADAECQLELHEPRRLDSETALR